MGSGQGRWLSVGAKPTPIWGEVDQNGFPRILLRFDANQPADLDD
jgi:hypothetical protein